MLRACVLAVLVAATLAAPVINFDATAYCTQCLSRRNHKDLYPDPNNVSNYYACQYLDDGTAIATLRNCAAGLVWNSYLLTCTPDGTVTGTDANLPSPTQYNSTVCKDSYGNYISSVAGNSNAYAILDGDGNAATVQYCPNAYTFSLSSCACTDGSFDTSNLSPVNKATFYMDFNAPNQYVDLSINHFQADFLNGATITAGLSDHSPSGSSLSIPNAGARVEVAGIKGFDFKNQATWCGFFLCDYYPGSLNCNETGGILSNNNGPTSSEFTFVFGVQATNTFVAKLSFGSSSVTLSSSFSINPPNSPRGFNSYCVTYNGQTANLYLQGALADSESFEGSLNIGQCPMTLGNDQAMGTFLGHMDSTLLLNWVWSATEIQTFHNTGQVAAAYLA